jgi:hypothetical protein
MSDNLDSVYDADEAEKLGQGIVALTDDHLYFLHGDILDVYLARKLENEQLLVFSLTKFDPMNDTDESILSRKPLLYVAQDGELMYESDGEYSSTGWNVKALYPFGEKQYEWYRQMIESED